MNSFLLKNQLKIYPNPYNNYTNISYILKKESDVNIEIYDIVGEKLSVIVNRKQQPGKYKYQFSAKALGYSQGLYLLRFKMDGNEVVRKLVEVY